MPVAKSYENNRILCEPYVVNGRKYVRIETEPKPGVFSSKQVRYYTDAEYKKMYGDEVVDHSKDPYWRSQKDVLGFKNGYIWIFMGNTYDAKEDLKAMGAVYRQNWGWGISSELPEPTEIPAGVQMLKLDWDKVGSGEKLLPDDRVQEAVKSLIYANTPKEDLSDRGEFVGEVGQRLEMDITVVKNIETQYGRMMFFEDADEHTFVWATSAKNWEVGSEHHIRGTVKKHDRYKGLAQTWLSRCMEVKAK